MCVILIVSECFNRITSLLTPTFFGPLPNHFKNSSVSVYLDANYVMTLCSKVLRNSDTDLSEPPSSKILVAYQFRIFQAPFAYF